MRSSELLSHVIFFLTCQTLSPVHLHCFYNSTPNCSCLLFRIVTITLQYTHVNWDSCWHSHRGTVYFHVSSALQYIAEHSFWYWTPFLWIVSEIYLIIKSSMYGYISDHQHCIWSDKRIPSKSRIFLSSECSIKPSKVRYNIYTVTVWNSSNVV